MLYLPKAYPSEMFPTSQQDSPTRKIFPPLKKELNLTTVKRAAQACQVGPTRGPRAACWTPLHYTLSKISIKRLIRVLYKLQYIECTTITIQYTV